MAETLKTKVAVLEAELSKTGEVLVKLDTTIDRMAEISSSINQMLAVHEQQIAQTEQDTDDLFQLVERRRLENDENLKQLHSRITTNGKEMRQEMNANVIKIMHAIEEVKDLMVDRERIINKQQAELEDRINKLEKRNYFFMGGAAVIGFIVGAFDWIVQLFSWQLHNFIA